eukprot:900071_1
MQQKQRQIPLAQQQYHDSHDQQPHIVQHSNFHPTPQRITHMPISQITVQLQATQAQLNSMVPQLTILQTQLQTQRPHQNTQQLETHYRRMLSAYEQYYGQYLWYLKQIEQLQTCHNAKQTLRLSGSIYCDEMNVDFNLFKIKHFHECDINASDSSKCISMKRLAVALKHYSTRNSDDQDVFGRFMFETYHGVIDDYIHFQRYHGNELERIHQDLIHIHKFVECDIGRCAFTSRHHRSNQCEKQDMWSLDLHLNFYKDLMDTLHFHVFHCFDTGLRCTKDNGDAKDDLETGNDCVHFDAAFARMNKAISERHHITASFARFSTNNSK